MVLIDQPGLYSLRGKFRAGHGDVTVCNLFHPPDGIRLELWFDPRPGGRDGLQRPGVDNLVCRLPDLRKVPYEWGLAACVHCLPNSHCLVHSATVEVSADRTQEVADE